MKRRRFTFANIISFAVWNYDAPITSQVSSNVVLTINSHRGRNSQVS